MALRTNGTCRLSGSFGKEIALTASCAGLRGQHRCRSVFLSIHCRTAWCPRQPPIRTALPGSIGSCFLNVSVVNPYYPNISQGSLEKSNGDEEPVATALPPQYGSISNSGHYAGISNYNSLEVKLQKRLPHGGQLLGVVHLPPSCC